MQNLEQQIESIIFASDKPVTLFDITDCINRVYGVLYDGGAIEDAIQNLLQKYKSELYSFEIVFTGGGLTFLSKAAYHEIIAVYLNQKSKKRLSNAAMETLAIIAYKQPITKMGVEQIRGVNCDYSISKLLEKELIKISGRADGPGKPVLYSTSESFMDYFGINSVKDLPKPKDVLPKEENEIGMVFEN